jgi:hypothetical protein
MGGSIGVKNVVGFIGIRIYLILFRPLPLTLTPINLVLIARFMVMMWTIVSHYI